jgi:hypothetical protein
MIWSTSYHHVTVLVHRSWRHLLFTLATGPWSQISSWSSPPWSHDSMSCLICNELLHITCVSFAPSSSHLYRHGIYCSHTYTCGLITYVSHINTISPPKLSLNYQNQTRTFQSADPTLGPLVWCPFLVPSRVESKQNMVPNWLWNDGGTRCKNKSEWSTIKDEICYDIWVPSVGPVGLYFYVYNMQKKLLLWNYQKMRRWIMVFLHFVSPR